MNKDLQDRSPNPIRIGTAGWSIPTEHAHLFDGTGTHLERYARRFSCVEINSTFYKSHLRATYERWANSVPDTFRFSVKMPREITHFRRLADTVEPLERFLTEVDMLGSRRGPLLVQLPPRLAFQEDIARTFLAALRDRFSGDIVCEPRHASWFDTEAERALIEFRIARAAADPAILPAAAQPGGWNGLTYYRLHGSSHVYYSDYSDTVLEALAHHLEAVRTEGSVWCIFDNTAAGAATTDAMKLIEFMNGSRSFDPPIISNTPLIATRASG